jgi:long-chain acyl-CoA synthetase
VSGSAALSQDVAEFFHAAGILILEGYGLTETSAEPSSTARPLQVRHGGAAVPRHRRAHRRRRRGAAARPGVMTGYHGLPEQTAEALDRGRLAAHRDIGELDATASSASPTARRT